MLLSTAAAASSVVPSFGVFETLTQYGALGVITLGLGAALWFLLKRQIASEDKLKSEVSDLRKEMNEYMRKDQGSMKDAIENNTRALNQIQLMIIQQPKKTSK
jgi:hypothetical protein